MPKVSCESQQIRSLYVEIVKNALKTSKNVLKMHLRVNFVKKCKKMQNKKFFKIISITQNTFYTYGPMFQNTRKKDAFASKSQL